MSTLRKRARSLVALGLLLPGAAAAQGLNPTPMDPSHPNAHRAAAVVERIVAGDREGTVQLLRQEGDPGWVAGPMEQGVDRQIARLAPAGKWKIDRFEAAGIAADVIVHLTAGTERNALAIRMDAAPPHRMMGFALPRFDAGEAAPAGSGPPIPPLTAEDRRVVVDSIGRLLEAFHAAPDTGRMIADRIRQQERGGAYARLAREAFAQALTADLQAVNGDRHLYVLPPGAQVRRPGGDGTAAADNYGFSRTEMLEGNVGYVRVAGPLLDDPGALDAAAAAFRAVEGADAVILDLRGVPGGSPMMVDWIASHFVAPGTPLVRVYDRRAGTDAVREARASVAGPRRLDVPLYVLVDGRSASAAEALPFILQGLKRATIVGERTRGAGRNNMVVDVGSGFAASVTFTRVTNPRTGRGWEGVGIQPEIAVPGGDALRAAHQDALRKLGRATGGA